jgi:hypothetical protein
MKNISDSFKNKSLGIKDSLEPKSLVRMLTGDSANDSVYVNDSKKSVSKKKNPNYSSIGRGPVRPVKLGDSFADILAKTYNFMQKTEEIYKKQNQIEKDFRQEQIDEDERRHKELLKVIKSYTKTDKKFVKKKEYKNDENFFKDFLKGLLAALGLEAIISGIKPIFDGIKSIWNSVKDLWDKFTNLVKDVLPYIVPGPVGKPQTKPSAKPKTEPSAKPKAEPKPRSSNKKPPSAANDASYKKMTPAANEPTYEKSPTSKVGKTLALKGIKVTSDLVLRGINGTLDLLNKIPGLRTIAIGQDLFGEMQGVYNDFQNYVENPKESTSTLDDFLFRVEKIFAKYLGGLAGMELGGLIGASVGTAVGGPWGTLLGGLGGTAIGTTFGEELGGALFERYMTGEWPKVDTIKASKYAKENGFVISEGGAAFGGAKMGRRNAGAAPLPLPFTEPKLTIPEKYMATPVSQLSGRQNIINNNVNTINGNPPKKIQTSTTNVRNSDITQRLKASAAPV